MIRSFIPGCIITCITLPLYGQQLSAVRYKDRVFATVAVSKNITYGSDLPDGTKSKYYLLDLYQPENDTSLSRPLIIWIHGGGFKFGNKGSRGTPLWCRRFAERGYVCASVNYRLSKKNTLSDLGALINACSDAVEDVYKAVSFFKKNHALYKIDTTRIILAGNSAGGMTALQAAYGSTNPTVSSGTPAAASAYSTSSPGHMAAVINFWGSMFDTSWLKNTNVPVVSVHGIRDRIVPAASPDKGIYGSLIIHRYADALHIPNSLKIYEGYAHELQKHFNPLWAGKAARKRWEEAGSFAAGFLYKELFE